MTPYKAIHLLTDVLERATQEWPDKDAYRCDDQSLSYAELAKRAGQLNTALRGLGVAKGDLVGVFLPQSLDLPVAIYGILGAGAAFVPIDPAAPKARVESILKKCGINVVVVGKRQARIIDQIVTDGTPVGAVIGAPSETTKALSWASLDNLLPSPPVRMIEIDIAYVMFTSGSTGEPKGMVHTHANGMIYADNLIRHHKLHGEDRFLNLSPLHFDMAIMDHVAALMLGATTIIVSEATARLPVSLTKLAAREKASVWYSVPFVMIEMLLKGGMEQHDLSSLRWMIYGGEAFQIKHLKALQTALPNARFSNAYGPAETHQVSAFDIDPITDDGDQAIPIGAPWSTVDALIVDEDNMPVGTDEHGELLVRAPSCMLGYWGDPERTNAAFYETTVRNNIKKCYYRTGDIVSQRADGVMFFHGRKDRQIKIRGNRVELEEVEKIITEHPCVEECAVIKNADGTHLIAVVTTTENATFDADALRKHCRAALPIYAVPSDVLEIDAFERTSSLKVDRVWLVTQLTGVKMAKRGEA